MKQSAAVAPAVRAGFLLSALLSGSSSVGAEELVVEFFELTFLVPSRALRVGDQVRFQWVAGEHTVTSGTGPEDPAAGLRFDVELNAQNSSFTLPIGPEFLDGGVSFFDRIHPNRVGFIEVSRGESEVLVGVVDNVFLPDRVFIFRGDSVRWEHEPMEDFHTITSGRSSLPEDDPGALFDAESSDRKPVFVYRFDNSGTYPYFCRPHESLGMTGTVYVQDTFLRGDATGDEIVDISDPVATLGFLFLGDGIRPCADALDSNDDGAVDIADAIFTLTFLFLGGVELPPPFPVAGGDRTEDGILCMEPPAPE